MTDNSRKWTITEAAAGLEGEAATIAQGGFRLIGAAALMYVSGVYWETPKLKAADVAGRIHAICETLAYGRSSRYQLAAAALKLARRLTRKWGQPDAAGRNAAWTMLQEAAGFAEAVDLIVSQIKADYAVATLKELYLALDGNRAPPARAAPPLPQAFAAAIDRAGASPDQITAAIVTVIERHLGADQINALMAACANRIAGQLRQAA